MLNPALLAALGNILPATSILTASEDTRPYECDGLTLFREEPNAVLLPESEAQVVAILKLCHAARLPVVARGAGTGLSGGALPDRNGVVLSLAKFMRILAIDPLSRTATVQPGVRNLAISEAAAAHGLFYAPDPSSQIACTIGGNVAENSGGVHCLKYGLTLHNLRRVRAALIAEEVAAEVAAVTRLMAQSGATLIDVSRDEKQREKFWSGRKAAFPAAGRISPDYYCMDGTIPRRALAPVLQRIAGLSEKFGLPCMNVFHAGDGNLHPLILYDANRPGDAAKTQAFGARILELCIEVGGTITGEHGVGVEKIGDMCVQFAPAELERFHDVKRAFDAEGLLNPGMAVPTLHRCAEIWRMHVHRGELPHQELPRF